MDETTRELYDRAEHLRRVHDYDGALAAYESIVSRNPEDAAARWAIVLCRYGIEYTHDNVTQSDVPSINRLSFDSILEDRDYLMALRCAPEDQAAHYRSEAVRIAEIQDQFVSIVRAEKPYDVFISFKSSDGRMRTRDYALAQEIYDALTTEGFRVFFSPVSLRHHLGEVYEPYIFAALYSARVMVLVGTQKEYVEADWVRNEWSRYLYLMQQDPKKHLLPVYEGMNPADFPAQIARMQAIDLSQIGALQLVCTRVKDMAGEKEKVIYVRRKDGVTVNATNLVRRITLDVEDGAFDEASQRIKAFVDEYGADYADLRYARLLCANRSRNVAELATHLSAGIASSEDLDYVLTSGSDEQKTALQSLESLSRRYEQRKLVDDGIRSARDAYEAGRYADTISTIDVLRRLPCFDRGAEVDQLYAMARRQQEAIDKRAEFLQLTESGSYLRNLLSEKSPNIYQKLLAYEQFRAAPQSSKERLRWSHTIAIACCVATIVGWFIFKQSLDNVTLIVCLTFAALETWRFFRKEEWKALSTLALAVLKGFLLTFGPSLALSFILIQMHAGASDRSTSILSLLSRFWYGEADSDAGVLVVVYLGVLLTVIARNVSGALKENEARKTHAVVKQSEEQALQLRRELSSVISAFEEEERLRLEQEYGPYLQEDDWKQLGHVSEYRL